MSENTFTLTCPCGAEVLKVESSAPIAIHVHGALAVQCRECKKTKTYLVGRGSVIAGGQAVSIVS